MADRHADRDTDLVIARVVARRRRKISRGKSREADHQEDSEDEEAASQGFWTPDGAAQRGEDVIVLSCGQHQHMYTSGGGESSLFGRWARRPWMSWRCQLAAFAVLPRCIPRPSSGTPAGLTPQVLRDAA